LYIGTITVTTQNKNTMLRFKWFNFKYSKIKRCFVKWRTILLRFL